MDETDRGKVVRFFLAGSVLCLVGMFFSFYQKVLFYMEVSLEESIRLLVRPI